MVENINEEEMENQKNLEQLRLDIYGNISFDRNAEASEDNDLEINLQSSLEIEEFMNIEAKLFSINELQRLLASTS